MMRIVSLAPSNTEIVAALGLLEQLVGVDDHSDWPPAVASLPRVGPDLQVDIAKVQALAPDLVLASLSVPGMERVVAGIQAAGLPHLVLNPHSLADIYADIRTVAVAAGVATRGERVVSELQARVEAAALRAGAAANRRGRRLRLYWEWWPRPLFSPGGRNWLTEISALAGGENLFAGVDQEAVRPDPDQVAALDPDVILAAWTGVWQERIPLERITGRPGWERLRAVREGRVYALAEGKYNRPSPRLVDGLEELVELLAPLS